MLQVVGTLSPRRMFASNITPAALFRAVEKYRPTLLIDEGDTFLRDNEELRGILNSGHTKGTAYVVRTVGDDHEPTTFKTWCPKIIALIGKLKDTLEDRSIVIPLRRKGPGEAVERLRADRLQALDPVCRKAWRWGQDNLDALRTHEPDVPPELHDRAADNWRPLLAVADLVGGDWPEHARNAATALSCPDAGDTESMREQLLADIRILFESRGTDRLFGEDIVSELAEMDGRPWPEFSRGKPLTKAKLARLLKPFGIRPKTVRIGDDRAKGYELEDFKDAFSRYIPPRNRDTVTTPGKIDENAFSNRDTEKACHALESAKTPESIDLSRCHALKGGYEQASVKYEEGEI
jgi:putative DNA primase/helicase